jgi:hypothetical protein
MGFGECSEEARERAALIRIKKTSNKAVGEIVISLHSHLSILEI